MNTVNFSQMERAARDVQGELRKLGLWHERSKLRAVDVVLCLPAPTLPTAHGFFVCEETILDALLGYRAGHIFIPRFFVGPGMFGGRESLRDVIRHEYAHALEHHYPRLTGRSARFRETFGDGDDFVSDYAKTNPSEDFAETFMCFLRHGGMRPKRFSTRPIRRKWGFVRDACGVIKRGRSVW